MGEGLMCLMEEGLYGGRTLWRKGFMVEGPYGGRALWRKSLMEEGPYRGRVMEEGLVTLMEEGLMCLMKEGEGVEVGLSFMKE